MTRLISSGRSTRSVSAWIVALAVVSPSACTTGPRDDFTGSWSSELPKGVGISFSVEQRASMVSGSASNCGPAVGSVTGSVIGEHVSLAFRFPPPLSMPPAPPDSVVPWTFQGAFSRPTTIEGAATDADGATGPMVITLVSRAVGGRCM